jgi:NADH-quinone oxidoreductase subunit I
MGTILVSKDLRPSTPFNTAVYGTLALARGLWTTLYQLLYNLANRRKLMTVEYPFEKVERSERFHGTHVLTKKADGDIRCTACMLCATACPAECIRIVASESDDPTVEKFPEIYEIDALRCIFCGYCEEACPVDAIRLTPEYEFSNIASSNFIWDINYLMNRPSLKGGVLSKMPEETPHMRKIKGISLTSST